jgi:RNA polymerase sigma factor (sigma-70 family)
MINGIIQGCLSGEMKAHQELYNLYRVKMYVLCQRYLSNAEDAKDVLQEGFIKIFRDLHQFDPEKGKFEHWMKRVFVNTCLETFRRKRIDFTSLDVTVQLPSLDENALSALSLQELTRLIQNLPIGYRTVFNMYVIEGYSHPEIAEKLNISESTSKTQFMKAKFVLRQKLEESLN